MARSYLMAATGVTISCLVCAGGSAAAPSATSEAVTVIGPQQPADACLEVATAKYAQWTAKKLEIQQTETLADGSSKTIEAIFTPDSAYGREDGMTWSTMNLVFGDRQVPAPEAMVKHMGLAACRFEGITNPSGRPLSIYALEYVPDARASHVSGEIWISPATGLPLRQELHQDAEPWHRQVAVAISVHFLYDDDVQVPLDAVRSDNLRRWLVQRGFLANKMLIATSHGGHR
ncbi:MAG TPA: hypothetical protein VII49_13760 [Rhizomicrobium sp.]